MGTLAFAKLPVEGFQYIRLSAQDLRVTHPRIIPGKLFIQHRNIKDCRVPGVSLGRFRFPIPIPSLLTETITGFTPDGTPVSRTTTRAYDGPLHQLSFVDGPRTDVADHTWYRSTTRSPSAAAPACVRSRTWPASWSAPTLPTPPPARCHPRTASTACA